MNSRFKTHGNFYHFCETLQKEEVVIAQQLENYVEGSIQREKQPKYLKKRHRAIKKYSIMLQNKEITPMVFLATMANRKNHIVYSDEDITLHETEVDLARENKLYGGSDDIKYEDLDYSLGDSGDSDVEITSSTSSTPSTLSQATHQLNADSNNGEKNIFFMFYISSTFFL